MDPERVAAHQCSPQQLTQTDTEKDSSPQQLTQTDTEKESRRRHSVDQAAADAKQYLAAQRDAARQRLADAMASADEMVLAAAAAADAKESDGVASADETPAEEDAAQDDPFGEEDAADDEPFVEEYTDGDEPCGDPRRRRRRAGLVRANPQKGANLQKGGAFPMPETGCEKPAGADSSAVAVLLSSLLFRNGA